MSDAEKDRALDEHFAPMRRVTERDLPPRLRFSVSITLHVAAGDLLTREPMLLATYRAGPDGEESQLWVSAMPARFYEVTCEGYRLSTGSGTACFVMACDIAESIAVGMLTVKKGAA